MARLVLMCGLPGSGKTTLAMRLERTLAALRLAPDEWLTTLGWDGYDGAGRERVERLQRVLAERVLALGANVILENGFWSRRERDEIRHWARDHAVAIELRVIDAPLSVLKDRIRARNRALPPGMFPVREEDLATWEKWFEAPTPAELALFDAPIAPS